LKGARRPFHPLAYQAPPPDVVVLGLTAAQDATLVPALLARWPLAQIMTVTEAGDGAAMFELRPRGREFGEMSPAELVKILREAAYLSRASQQM
jgi:hypothetical protein